MPCTLSIGPLKKYTPRNWHLLRNLMPWERKYSEAWEQQRANLQFQKEEKSSMQFWQFVRFLCRRLKSRQGCWMRPQAGDLEVFPTLWLGWNFMLGASEEQLRWRCSRISFFPGNCFEQFSSFVFICVLSWLLAPLRCSVQPLWLLQWHLGYFRYFLKSRFRRSNAYLHIAQTLLQSPHDLRKLGSSLWNKKRLFFSLENEIKEILWFKKSSICICKGWD